MTSGGERYRTNDIALVTYLRMDGFEILEHGWIGRACFWWFDLTPDLLTAVDLFETNQDLVPPKEFSKIFGRTKNEMHSTKPKVGDDQGV